MGTSECYIFVVWCMYKMNQMVHLYAVCHEAGPGLITDLDRKSVQDWSGLKTGLESCPVLPVCSPGPGPSIL